jgi:hypothetical protein
MKTLLQIITLPLIALALTSCNGIKPSTDNAELSKGQHFGSDGKLATTPEVSVPVWKSDGLKQKPVDITPVKSDEK